MSFVCEKHERYVPDGEECPYCETGAAAPQDGGLFGINSNSYQFWRSTPPAPMNACELQRMMNEVWVKMARPAEPLHARADGSKCLCGSPTCPNPAGMAVKEWPHFMGTPIIPWPKQLEHVPPEFRFVQAKTGKPKPLFGIHFGSADGSEVCAMCGKSGMEIRQNPLTPCEYPWPPEAS